MCYTIENLENNICLSFNESVDLGIEDVVVISHKLIAFAKNNDASQLVIRDNNNYINLSGEAKNYLKTNNILLKNFKQHAYVTNELSNRITAHYMKRQLSKSEGSIFKSDEEAIAWFNEINLN